jgi:glutaredoxin 2
MQERMFPAIAQLVERLTVEVMPISGGRWFESALSEYFFNTNNTITSYNKKKKLTNLSYARTHHKHSYPSGRLDSTRRCKVCNYRKLAPCLPQTLQLICTSAP